VARRRESAYATAIRIQFDNLYNLARAGRKVRSAVCVGSVPPELRDIWNRLATPGVAIELYERGGASGKEQGVDQCLQVHTLKAMADLPPLTAVLLTGDGAWYGAGAGYHADLERLHRKGWGIEMLSWDIACNRRLKEWATSAGAYIKLEDYYTSVTFIEGGRRSDRLSLVHRKLAAPALPAAV
jgi:hypothetical protein